jgi:hypothetical protein
MCHSDVAFWARAKWRQFFGWTTISTRRIMKGMKDNGGQKNPAAVALGRLGGLRRVRKGLAMVSAERVAEISRAGVEARRAKLEARRAASEQSRG